MRLEDLGWNNFFAVQLSDCAENDGVTVGRVSEQHRQLYRVLTEAGEMVANISGHLRSRAMSLSELPAVGDWVTLRAREAYRATIEAILPRRSQLSRRAAGNRVEEQIIGANIDTVFIVTALDGDFSLRRIERYLSLVRQSGARPIVVLNKSDAAEDLHAKVLACEAIAQDASVHAVSAITAEGLNELRSHFIPGETIVFVGSSGVGKSTLINAFLGHNVQATNSVRQSDAKGRHTTTSRRLLPLPGGALLLDTPGMREVQLWADEDALDATFADIAELASGCRFRDCTHRHEPGCAVRGSIAEDRLNSFHKQQKELAHQHRQTDIFAAQHEKQRWKTIHKTMRNFRPGGKF